MLVILPTSILPALISAIFEKEFKQKLIKGKIIKMHIQFHSNPIKYWNKEKA
jgi:hypothetical protein